eukprot:jgi/Bigna1/128142/aug1.6_g2850
MESQHRYLIIRQSNLLHHRKDHRFEYGNRRLAFIAAATAIVLATSVFVTVRHRDESSRRRNILMATPPGVSDSTLEDLTHLKKPEVMRKMAELFKDPEMLKGLISDKEMLSQSFKLLQDPKHMEKIKSLFSDPKFSSEINGLIKNPDIFNNVRKAREMLENTPEVRDQVRALESQFRNLMESDLHFNEVITDVKKNGRAAISRVMKDEANLRLLWSKVLRRHCMSMVDDALTTSSS